MHVSFAHALVVAAVISSVVLLLQRDDRLFPLIALVASGLEALMVFHVIELSSGKLRIDLILPGLIAVAGGVCWTRCSGKPSITAATVATLVGVLQLVLVLDVMH
jgi:hypothetical protein